VTRPNRKIVKAEGPCGPAKIHSVDPETRIGSTPVSATIGYNAWIEDTNGNEIDEKALKIAVGPRPPPEVQSATQTITAANPTKTISGMISPACASSPTLAGMFQRKVRPVSIFGPVDLAAGKASIENASIAS
jgi:hypothetical protein